MKPPDIVLEEWVRAANAGCGASWKALYTHFYPGMYATAIGICRNPGLAADLVQDAFVTAYLKLSQLNDATKFGAWLKQILTHKCYRSIKTASKLVSAYSRWYGQELTQSCQKEITGSLAEPTPDQREPPSRKRRMEQSLCRLVRWYACE